MGIWRSNDPTTFDDVDQIVINETAPPPNIQGAAANVAILVGQFERGPETLTEVGGTQELYETFGKYLSSGLKALKSKKFGRLKIIRAVAAAAVGASKAFQSSATDRITFAAKWRGAYGNSIQVKIEEASTSRQHAGTITTIADTAGVLDQKYFVLADEVGTVGFWINDNGAGTAPAGALAAARQVEISTIVSGDSASVVATKVAAAINADSKFTASAVGTLVSWNVDAYAPEVGSESAGDSGFTVTETVAGVYGGKKYTIKDNSATAALPTEVYDGVKIAEVVANASFAASALVDATVNSSAAEPSNAAFTNLISGSDGTIADTDYEAAIALAEVERAGNFLFLDEYNATRRGYLKVHVQNAPDKMVVLAGPEVQLVADAITDVANYRDTDGRIIYAYPWVKTTIDGTSQFVSPASFYASLLSQTAPNIDPAYTANSGFLAGITELKYSLNRANYVNLLAAGISAFEVDSDVGVKVKSGVTTQTVNSSKIMVFRRRMADYLTESAARFLKNYQNAPNTVANRRAVKAALLAFIEQQESAGLLPRDTEVQNGLAKLVDVEVLNTNTSIALGFFKILWKQRIFSSMRFIVIEAEIGESVVVTAAA